MVSKIEQDCSTELVPLSSKSGTDEETSSNSVSEYSDSEIHIDGGAGGGHAEFGEPGSASKRQVAVNIFISFVGSGMLGMPYGKKFIQWITAKRPA